MSSSLHRLLTCMCQWDSEGSLVADDPAHPYNPCKSFDVHLAGISRRLLADSMGCTAGQTITIDDLPDDVLLEIFDFHVVEYQNPGFVNFGTKREVESWQLLVHVCRRWRGLVFASPRRLNLRLWCKPVTSVRMFLNVTSARMSLDVWPALPLIIYGNGYAEDRVDTVIAELEYSDRICQIEIYISWFTTWEIEELWTAMQVPFPELTALRLVHDDSSSVPFLPDSFLCGSAPRLRSLALASIPFP